VVQAGVDQGRQLFRPVIDGFLGMLAFFRGEYDAARSHLERATARLPEEDEYHIEGLWYSPHDPLAFAHEHLAIDRLWHGDLAGAESQLTNAIQRADQLGFPQGPYNDVYTIDMEIWMRVEARQFDRARALVAELIEKAEQYGFDFWQLFGVTEQCLVDAEALLACGDPDPTVLATQIATLTEWVDFWRAVGLNAYQTHYDCVVAQLLTAAGRPEEARTRIDTAMQLADDTGMHFYDAELLRARAHTHTETDAGAADVADAIALARRQDAPLFELRAAIDDFELRGQVARAVLADAADRLPTDSALPEVGRARALLG
jgi:tetratricopeptide (TPR) repeat protein